MEQFVPVYKPKHSGDMIRTFKHVPEVLGKTEYAKTRAYSLCNQAKQSTETRFIRFTVTSDTHSKQEYLELPGGDVLIHCGDSTMYGLQKEYDGLNDWLARQKYTIKIIIAGNHEFNLDTKYFSELKTWIIDQKFYDPAEANNQFTNTSCPFKGCIYLQHQAMTLYGYKIFGTPYTPVYSRTAFQRAPKELARLWAEIPTDTDILITHGPAHGTVDTNRAKIQCGCPALAEELKSRVRPLYHLNGHIHEGYGAVQHNGTVHINAAFCGKGYVPMGEPFTFELPDLSSKTLGGLPLAN